MKIPDSGIVVDGSTRRNPGPSEYRGMDLSTGRILFHREIGVATNNVTEFIALGHAVLLSLSDTGPVIIYSDSQTALTWLLKKNIKSNLPNEKKTKKAREYLNRIELKLKTLSIKKDGIGIIVENKITVKKWDSSVWGEIPADFGYKK